MSQDQLGIFQRALEREKIARRQAEKILEEKSAELYFVNKELSTLNKELESLVTRKDSQLQGVFENIVDSYVIMDLEGNILKMNNAALDLLGFANEKVDFNLMQMVLPKDVDKGSRSFEDLLVNGRLTDFEITIKTYNGESKLIHINASVIYDNDEPIAAQGIIRDITSIREKELVVEVINDIAQSILGKFDIYEIAYQITDKIANYLESDDCVIYLYHEADNTLEQISAFGEKVDENNQIVNKIVLNEGTGIVGSVAKSGKAELINNTDLDPRYIKDIVARKSEITIPIMIGDKVLGVIDSENEKENFFTAKHLNMLMSIASIIALQLKSAIDLRERKKVEARNIHLFTELEKSNNELQEYAHIVSHDLKSPLRSINALVSWLKEDNTGKLDEISMQNFGLIETTLEKMEQLISDILEYSSVGSDSSKKVEVDLNMLMADIEQILHIPASIRIEILDPLPQIMGERTMLQQLFQNIVGNAIRYMDKEKGLIQIGFKDQKSFYEFSIRDNGIGIDKKYHEKIFKIFHSLNESKESSGIGLSIVKKIVEHHKGKVWLESEPGVGTTFFFTLKKQ